MKGELFLIYKVLNYKMSVSRSTTNVDLVPMVGIRTIVFKGRGRNALVGM